MGSTKIFHFTTLGFILLARMALSAPECTDVAKALEQGNRGVVLSSVGLVDLKTQRLYFPNANLGIDALDLQTGGVIWTTGAASWPLAVAGECLIARTEGSRQSSMRVSLHDWSTGVMRRNLSSDVTLPNWVMWRPYLRPHSTPVCDYGYWFNYEWELAEQNLFIQWDAHTRYPGGGNPSPDTVRRYRKDLYGVESVDLVNRRVRTVQQSITPVLLSNVLNKLPESLRALRSEKYFVGSNSSELPFIVGDRAVVFVSKRVGSVGEEEISLVAYDLKTATKLFEKAFYKGQYPHLRLQPDKATVIAHPGVPIQDFPEDEKFWSVFSVASGERVTKIALTETGGFVGIIGQYVFRTVGEDLVVKDLTSNRLLWKAKRFVEAPCPPR